MRISNSELETHGWWYTRKCFFSYFPPQRTSDMMFCVHIWPKTKWYENFSWNFEGALIWTQKSTCTTKKILTEPNLIHVQWSNPPSLPFLGEKQVPQGLHHEAPNKAAPVSPQLHICIKYITWTHTHMDKWINKYINNYSPKRPSTKDYVLSSYQPRTYCNSWLSLDAIESVKLRATKTDSRDWNYVK